MNSTFGKTALPALVFLRHSSIISSLNFELLLEGLISLDFCIYTPKNVLNIYEYS